LSAKNDLKNHATFIKKRFQKTVAFLTQSSVKFGVIRIILDITTIFDYKVVFLKTKWGQNFFEKM
jgi:hypothetical protein